MPVFNGALPLLASDIDSETGGSTKRYPFDINEYPAIANWQKAPTFSVLGFLASVLARLIALFVVTIATEWIAEGIFTNQLTLVVFSVASLIYAAFVYPSFFEEKPLLRSNKAISFWNVFSGGPIFGWFWNGNLSYSWISNRCEIGVSHIVLVTLCVLHICTMVVGIFIGWEMIQKSMAHAI